MWVDHLAVRSNLLSNVQGTLCIDVTVGRWVVASGIECDQCNCIADARAVSISKCLSSTNNQINKVKVLSTPLHHGSMN